jgi:hypothetical protein
MVVEKARDLEVTGPNRRLGSYVEDDTERSRPEMGRN